MEEKKKKTTSNYFMHSFHFGAITPVTQKDTSEKRGGPGFIYLFCRNVSLQIEVGLKLIN